MTGIVWTSKAREDLRAIRDYISQDSPTRANAFVSRLINSVDVLRDRPFLGAVLPELRREDMRELIRGNYRIVYRVKSSRVTVITVHHGARQLDARTLEGWDAENP
jgi:addiction module RelE/StbE family toxin